MASTAQSKAREFRGHWVDEMNGAATYRALAERAHGEQRDIFLELAEAEERHARHWAKKLVDLGEPEPGPGDYREDLRTRVISWLARHLGPSAALSGIRRGERWHRGDSSGALRAAIFGVNDGLVSNLSLVMGVTGGQADRKFILLAGLAGLLAGAFSMGAGEFISVTSQRELFQREIALESEEIETMPEEEANELALIYRAKGIGREDAEAMAARIMRDPLTALDTMAREELGLNPEELGSPTRVAASSFTAFAIGAVVPVLAWVFSAGAAAFVTSIILSALALFLVGAGISLLTGRSAIRSGIRQLLVGGAAAIATFGIGRLIGVSVS